MLYVFTNEAYNTLNRTTAMGFACGAARIATCLMPVIVFYIVELNVFYPFLFFFILALLSTYFTYLLPFDTAL
jgi:hypothetical protein